jgi:hypothetical protein
MRVDVRPTKNTPSNRGSRAAIACAQMATLGTMPTMYCGEQPVYLSHDSRRREAALCLTSKTAYPLHWATDTSFGVS